MTYKVYDNAGNLVAEAKFETKPEAVLWFARLVDELSGEVKFK